MTGFDPLDGLDRSWSYRPVLWGVVLIVSVFLVWASGTKIDQHVRGYGTIIPSGKARTVQHLEGGIVREILVHEGEQIAEGDVLFVIENMEARAELDELDVRQAALSLRLSRLQAEVSGDETLAFEESLVEKWPDIAASEMELFRARREEFMRETAALQSQARQKALKLEHLKSRKSNLEEELTIARRKDEINAGLYRDGAVSESKYLDARARIRDFETRIADVEKQIPVIAAEREETLEEMNRILQEHRAEIAEMTGAARQDLQRLAERRKVLRDAVTRTDVRAPLKGIVNTLYIHTSGGVVQPGAALADIIPLEEELVLEGQINTQDRGKIYPGLKAAVRLTAYDYTLYGAIDGRLDQVSADRFTDRQGRDYYRIRVTLDAADLPDDMPIYPGMQAQIDLLSGKTSIIHAILKPFLQIRDRALREY